MSNNSSNPFFSIGVTTYNRPEMLNECLHSILGQTFSDFEVIVGNDYTQQRLSVDFWDTDDPRIRFVNYPTNLGEHGNMHALLDMSCGRYFTWLADDDTYAPDFLSSVYNALVKFDFLPCVFTSFLHAKTFPDEVGNHENEPQLFEGHELVKQYLARKLKTIGFYGVFDTEYIRQIVPIEQLGSGFSPYSDNLIVIKSGLLEKVIYVDSHQLFFRAHEDSISFVDPEVDTYSSAQADLLPKCVELFESKEMAADFDINFFHLLKWCLSDYCTVMLRSGSLQFGKLIKYILFLTSYLKKLKTHRGEMMVIILRSTRKLVMQMVKESFKNKISLNFRKV